MKPVLLFSGTFRRPVAVLLGVALAVGVFWGGGQQPGWAAPGQLPDQQTIPPRPPRPDPPPEAPPAGEDGHDQDNDHEVPPPAPAGSQVEDGLPPVQAPEPIDTASNDEAAPGQRPQQQGVQDQLAPPGQSEPVEQGGPLEAQVADLSLRKTVDQTRPTVGETLTYRLVLHNSGPGLASGIAVGEPLPAGLVPGLTTATRGSYNDQTGEWLVDLIEPGQSLTLTLVVTVTNASLVTNTAEIMAAGQFDPDSTPGNNVASEDDQASAPLVRPVAQEDKTSPAYIEASGGLPGELGRPPAELNTSASGATRVIALALAELGWLAWLSALGLGLILIVGGLFLTSRS